MDQTAMTRQPFLRILLGVSWFTVVFIFWSIASGLFLAPAELAQQNMPATAKNVTSAVLIVLGLASTMGTAIFAEWLLYYQRRGILGHWRAYCSWKTPVLVAGGYLGIMIIYWTMITVKSACFGNYGVSANQQEVNKLSQQAPVLLAIVVMFLAPVIEEYLFRGIVMTYLAPKKPVINVLISAILFGLVHQMTVTSWSQLCDFVVYVAMGAMLAIVYQITGDLKTSITLHMLNNIVSCLL